MYKVMIGYLLVLLDISFQIGNDGNRADLLPDFIGFLIIIWGIWKWRKESQKFKPFLITVIVAFVYSYVAYVLDMFGIIYKWPDLAGTMISLFSDLLKMATVFIFIKFISDMEKNHGNLQSKKMVMIWRIMMVCYLAQYLFLSVQEVGIAFLVFGKIAAFTFLFYIFTSAGILSMEKKNMQKASVSNNKKKK